MTDKAQPIILHGKLIREDENGFVCLNDIWEMAKAPASKLPKHWRTNASVRALETALIEKVRKSDHYDNHPTNSVVYARNGRYGATFAHPVMAAAYAGYLSPKLEVEVWETWLRYRAADPTLADEVLERSSDEANRWAAARATSRIVRRHFTDTLQAAGVTGTGYGQCTNGLYRGLFLKNAREIVTSKGLPATAKPRDHMNEFELAQLSVAENMAAGRIEDEGRTGVWECAEASKTCGDILRNAIQTEKATRRKRLL